MPPVYRAPMRARDRDLPPGAGADFGVRRAVVGIGDALPEAPATLAEAVTAAIAEHGEKAGRMLRGFADLPEGTLVWTRTSDGLFWRGRLTGPWRYDDSPDARDVGIHHVRACAWEEPPLAAPDAPPAVVEAFARGGRNLQRIRAVSGS